MANGSSNQAQATGLLSQIPFGAIVGSPLKAAVDAQAAAALACYDFIRKIGFDAPDSAAPDKGDQALGAIKNITFSFKRTDAAGAGTSASITVPLLTIMPLPFIRIESMTVNFKASISAVDSRTQSDTSSTAADAKVEATVGFALWKANVGCSVSSKKDSTATNTSKYSVEHTMDVSVHAVQDDMPAGLAKMLSMMTDMISVSRA